jgi:hypothetical protein
MVVAQRTGATHMAIKITYTARGDKIKGEGTRFVRAAFTNDPASACYAWCIRSNSNKRHDLQQGTCDAHDLPDDIRAAADRLSGHAFGYVEWPQ